MTKDQHIELLGRIIDMLRASGLKIDSPYDFENFFADYATHFNLFETDRFPKDDS